MLEESDFQVSVDNCAVFVTIHVSSDWSIAFCVTYAVTRT